MDKALGKLGIYDILGVWLTGVIILLLTAITTNEVYGFHKIGYSYLENPIVLVAGGYFAGMFFQEMGNFLQRHLFNRNNRILKKILNEKQDAVFMHNNSLTWPERNSILRDTAFQGDKNDPDYIYNFCKHHVMAKMNTSAIDRNQVAAAISRSLGLHFVLMALLSLLFALHIPCGTPICVSTLIITALSFVFLSALFFYRSYRFVGIRYIQYFRAYYFLNNQKAYKRIKASESNIRNKKA